MMQEGLCVGCGGDCLGTFECSCGGREVTACQDCVDSGMNLVCGVCRDRAVRVVSVGWSACRDVVEAGAGRDLGGRFPVTAAVAAQGASCCAS